MKNSNQSGKDRIIFPLDVPCEDDALRLVKKLAGEVGMFKIGLELFVQAGPKLVEKIINAGPAGVFLDLKLHDIPVTVNRAMQRIAELGVTFATVHCGETPRMLEAAVQGAGGRVGVLAVTVLTSVSLLDIKLAGFRHPYRSEISSLVLKRAGMAMELGCTGVVCSGKEVKTIKGSLGSDFVAVTPGIRPAWDNIREDDQRRITTPAQAIQDGADFIVIGRPIRDASDPAEAARKIAAEVESAI